MERLRRKTEERIRYFSPTKPPHNDQRGFLYSPAKVRFAFGGNRSGKTEVGAADVIWLALGKHPVRSKHRQPPVYGRICAPKYEDGCKGVVLKKLRGMIPHHDLRGSMWIKAWSEKAKSVFFANGSIFTFKSFEMDLDTFGGDDLDFVWDDEHGPHRYFLENMARLTDRNGYYIKTMTPEAGQTWEEDFIAEPTEGVSVDHFFFDTDRNPYLSREGIQALTGTIKDERLKEAKLHGRFVPLTGMVIPQWNPAVHIVPDREVHPDAYHVFCMDCHIKTPSAALWAAWEPDGTLVVYRTAKRAYSVSAWQKYIRVKTGHQKVQLWLGDESESETTGTNVYGARSILHEFNQGPDALPLIQVQKGPASFDAGIYRLWDMFSVDATSKRSDIQVFQSCEYPLEYINGKPCGSLPWELKRYVFKKEQKADEETLREKVRKVDDHLIDCLRYVAMNKPGNWTEKPTGPDVALAPGVGFSHTEVKRGGW